MTARSARSVLWVAVAVLLVGFMSVAAGNERDSFSESVLLRPLPGGQVMVSFAFTMHTDMEDASHFDLFPKTLGQVVRSQGVKEMHISLSQGRWSKRWGQPVVPASTGAEVLARFDASSSASVNTRWVSLTSTLSGLFCASLNQLDMTLTSQAVHSFDHNPFSPGGDKGTVRYGFLSREPVCTENLTPWLKLLPCRDKAGLALLLHAPSVFSSPYRSIGIHVQSDCVKGQCTAKLATLNLTYVLKPQGTGQLPDITFRSLFRSSTPRSCAVASSSTVVVEPNHFKYPQGPWKVLPSPSATHGCAAGQQSNTCTALLYSLGDLRKQDLTFKRVNQGGASEALAHAAVQLRARRYLTGVGQERRGLVIELTNPDPATDFHVMILEAFPHFFTVYFHTLRLLVNGVETPMVPLDGREPVYVPVTPQKTPAVVELPLRVPANSTLSLSLQFDLGLRPVQDYPPDPNRGIDLGSTVITYSAFRDNRPVRQGGDSLVGLGWDQVSSNHHTVRQWDIDASIQRVYTDPIIVDIPVPDFSMPYNAVLLTSSVVVVFFGHMLNIFARGVQGKWRARLARFQ